MPYKFIQNSITSCTKLRIAIVIAFQKAEMEMHSPTKFQVNLRTTEKVVAPRTSASQWMASDFRTLITFYSELRIQFLKRVWKALETRNKLTNFQFRTIKARRATSIRSSALQTLTHNTHKKNSLEALLSPTFPSQKVKIRHISPYPLILSPTKDPIPFLIQSRTTQIL